MILLLGGTGYVGGAVQKNLIARGLPFVVASRSSNDYSSRDELVKLLRDVRPEFLIDAAGCTGRPNVDACEIHRTECLSGNAVLPGVILDACDQTGTPWVHVSSGCIFTGARSNGSGFTDEEAAIDSFRS